ncbi:DUF1045 domain-containing protein [Actibacterium lipolyticum]|uniref:Phosphonate metabolism protein n=1 Tax=Actibacterium lipolyticum TaxID=1524263 RepID=A0A238JVX0_9RHOB|nr:DUF1045 domain-containing protein [Actibacterium lipolyticum]SMX34337.1 hypothetical protein COL8621_01259 [Actibacterium lipolyticum]
MNGYKRYAIYYAPEPGPLAEFGAEWLGWDPVVGESEAPKEFPGLPCPAVEITGTPSKYGFHGTIKPPFRLADGKTAEGLHNAATSLAKWLQSVTLDGLELSRLGNFLALTPVGKATALASLASHVVMELDEFRAPPSDAEIQRRTRSALSPVQLALLNRWGYPYVMEEFRFHLTLSGRLKPDDLEATHAVLAPVLDPLLPQPFIIDSLCLFGEDEDGRFHNLHRYTLSG